MEASILRGGGTTEAIVCVQVRVLGDSSAKITMKKTIMITLEK